MGACGVAHCWVQRLINQSKNYILLACGQVYATHAWRFLVFLWPVVLCCSGDIFKWCASDRYLGYWGGGLKGLLPV